MEHSEISEIDSRDYRHEQLTALLQNIAYLTNGFELKSNNTHFVSLVVLDQESVAYDVDFETLSELVPIEPITIETLSERLLSQENRVAVLIEELKEAQTARVKAEQKIAQLEHDAEIIKEHVDTAMLMDPEEPEPEEPESEVNLQALVRVGKKHTKEHKFLSPKQKKAVVRMIKNDPFLPYAHIAANPEYNVSEKTIAVIAQEAGVYIPYSYLDVDGTDMRVTHKKRFRVWDKEKSEYVDPNNGKGRYDETRTNHI